MNRITLRSFLALFVLLSGVGLTLAQEPPQSLRIMAPASPGGGWDGTSRAMQTVLQETDIVPQVEVFNVPGAGGTVGLAQLATTEAGNGDILMMMGLVMVGSILTNDAPVTLDQATPVARLTAEYEVVVVPANSEYQTLTDLLDALKADPGSVSWGGGSAGGIDHILVGLIAQEAGVGTPQKSTTSPFRAAARRWPRFWAVRCRRACRATPNGRVKSSRANCACWVFLRPSVRRVSTRRRSWRAA